MVVAVVAVATVAEELKVDDTGRQEAGCVARPEARAPELIKALRELSLQC